tara:strand:+ start:4261 stop:4596 length:336 start_codon:yes stop_codon:yes gene_type:complete
MELHERPWGCFEIVCEKPTFWVRRLHIDPMHRLSMQRHLHRDEVWFVERGGGEAIVDSAVWLISTGAKIEVPRRTWHRLAAGDSGLTVIEVADGEPKETDIERSEDDYGRA